MCNMFKRDNSLLSFLFILARTGYVLSYANFTRLPEPDALKAHFDRSSRQIPSPKVHRCGEIGKDSVVNFVNTNYPNDDRTAGDCRFRLVITSQYTCQIRVDFVDTELMDPVRGECLSQYFIVQGAIWPTGLPPLCGVNNDQHFYLHLEPWYTNASVVDFNLVTVVRGRPYRFGVWLTQIDCSSFNVLKAPEGCTQYFLAENGTIKSFNYEGYRYLIAQNYQVCIRPVKGACGVRYDSAPGDFAMKKSILANRDIMMRSGVGPAICGTDYILIPEGREGIESVRRERLLFNRRRRPQQAATAPPPQKKKPEIIPSADRFCGTHLSPSGGEKSERPVFARIKSNLVYLRVKTSPLQEERGVIEALNLTAGFRITYRQIKGCAPEADLVIPQSIKSILESLQWNSDGGVAQREPSPSAEIILSVNSSLSSAQSSEDIENDDNLWEYLDLHSADEDATHEKDLYDF